MVSDTEEMVVKSVVNKILTNYSLHIAKKKKKKTYSSSLCPVHHPLIGAFSFHKESGL